MSGCLSIRPNGPVECPRTICYGCGKPWTDKEKWEATLYRERCTLRQGNDYCLTKLIKYDELHWSATCTKISN